MGGAISKTTRKLPTKPKPSWAGAATPMDANRASPGPSNQRASETKSDAIEKDSRDPQFMSNLSALGQVKVDHHMATFQTNTRMRNMLRSQQLSEQQASSSRSTRNRVLAGDLVDLLEERKFAKTWQDVEKVAQKYGLDVEVLESVAKTVTSTSILEGSRRTIVDEDGEERVTMTATWIDNPKLRTATN